MVNFDLPIVTEDYVHRTGTAGASGQVHKKPMKPKVKAVRKAPSFNRKPSGKS